MLKLDTHRSELGLSLLPHGPLRRKALLTKEVETAKLPRPTIAGSARMQNVFSFPESCGLEQMKIRLSQAQGQRWRRGKKNASKFMQRSMYRSKS